MSADPHLDGCADPLSVYEGTEAGVGVGNDPMTLGESKVGVLARNHRPLLLRKEIVANGGVAPDHNFVCCEGALALQLTAAILCENNLH